MQTEVVCAGSWVADSWEEVSGRRFRGKRRESNSQAGSRTRKELRHRMGSTCRASGTGRLIQGCQFCV